MRIFKLFIWDWVTIMKQEIFDIITQGSVNWCWINTWPCFAQLHYIFLLELKYI